MKLIFCGTPQFAVPTLETLAAEGFPIQLVVTQPDRPKGRGMELAHSPVKQSALKLGLPIEQPEKIKNNDAFRAKLEARAPDAIIVVGYGRIIPKWMLDLPKHGNINLHASLLPKYRGAAPIQWAIANGETVTGNTTMLINEGLDTGDILLQEEEAIAPDDTSLTLAPRLAQRGAKLMAKTLRGLAEGTIKRQPQDDSQATIARIITKNDGRIDFSKPGAEIYNRFRGFQPWPGAFTSFIGKTLKVTKMKFPASANAKYHAGASDPVEILEVQPEGKKPMPIGDYVRGLKDLSGFPFTR